MNYVWQQFKQEVKNWLVSEEVRAEDIVLEKPPEGIAGDVAWPCFVMAKQLGKSPQEIATEWAKKVRPGELIAKAEANGPYLNFFINKEKYYQWLAKEVGECGEMYGSLPKTDQKIGVEYLSPNTNKPLTIGHARNGSIGKSLVEILRFAGYEVVPIVLYNDRGVHICKSMLAYCKWGGDETPETAELKPDHLVGKYYIMFGQKAEEDDNLNDEVQQWLQRWEEGDREVMSVWKKMNDWFFDGVGQTLDRVGIAFEKKYLESEMYKFGKDLVEDSIKAGKSYVLDDGAVEVDLEDMKLGKKILRRNDGTSVYMVQDLYFAKLKLDDLDLDKSIYVVGSEQRYHFDVLFELLDRFGIADKSKMYHLAYAMVNTAEGKKMSSRAGVGDRWDDLLDELHHLAKKEILSRDIDISEDELEDRAEKIGQAALKFVLLNQDVNKAINFDKEEALRFDGETGPYLLYTYARIQSILAKAGDLAYLEISDTNPEMDRILMEISRITDYVERSAGEYNPAVMIKYLYGLCQDFNNFYHQHRVIDEKDEAKRNSRLAMLKMLSIVLKNGLRLLGIDALERM